VGDAEFSRIVDYGLSQSTCYEDFRNSYKLKYRLSEWALLGSNQRPPDYESENGILIDFY